MNKNIEFIEKSQHLDEQIFSTREAVGRLVTISDLMLEIKKDTIFFEESGGGVTFSGGEPMMQPEFVTELARQCKNISLHTALDTSGLASQNAFEEISDFIDVFLYDLKIMNNTHHNEFTGVSNNQILKNLRYLDKQKKSIIIRFPLIPTVNDDDDNLKQIIEFLTSLSHTPEIHILPYHRIGKNKYQQLGLQYKLANLIEPTEEEITRIKNIFTDNRFIVKIGG
jgi:pyruvate formate lyase activating enzyme